MRLRRMTVFSTILGSGVVVMTSAAGSATLFAEGRLNDGSAFFARGVFAAVASIADQSLSTYYSLRSKNSTGLRAASKCNPLIFDNVREGEVWADSRERCARTSVLDGDACGSSTDVGPIMSIGRCSESIV